MKAEVGSGSGLPASGAGAERQACQRGREKNSAGDSVAPFSFPPGLFYFLFIFEAKAGCILTLSAGRSGGFTAERLRLMRFRRSGGTAERRAGREEAGRGALRKGGR